MPSWLFRFRLCSFLSLPNVPFRPRKPRWGAAHAKVVASPSFELGLMSPLETKLFAFLAFGAAFTTLGAWMLSSVAATNNRKS